MRVVLSLAQLLRLDCESQGPCPHVACPPWSTIPGRESRRACVCALMCCLRLQALTVLDSLAIALAELSATTVTFNVRAAGYFASGRLKRRLTQGDWSAR